MIWVNPALIRFKITPHCDLRGKRGGYWDIERRFPIEQAVKYRSIVQRYGEGRDWADTDLFRETYARRIVSESIRGAATLDALLEQYRTRVDQMFEDLRRDGFDAGHPLPCFLLGRGGEIFIGNQGNHRLAMAHVLGLDKFAGEVICKHKLAA